jgi:hypothetical protein
VDADLVPAVKRAITEVAALAPRYLTLSPTALASTAI